MHYLQNCAKNMKIYQHPSFCNTVYTLLPINQSTNASLHLQHFPEIIVRQFLLLTKHISVSKQFLCPPKSDSITLSFLCTRMFFSVLYVRNTTELGGLRRRVSTFSEAGERKSSTVTMLKISTTCSAPYGISSVGSHSISCAITFLPSVLHVTLFGNFKFCREQSALTLI